MSMPRESEPAVLRSARPARAATILTLVVLLVSPALAGCLAPDGLDAASSAPLSASAVEVPEGARLEPVEHGLSLVWEKVDLPLVSEFAVPDGTTLVRATADVGGDAPLAIWMIHHETEQLRCRPTSTLSWNERDTGRMSCIGLAAIDPLPETWRLLVGSAADAADLVRIEFLQVPLEGPAAQLDLSQLSMPEHGVRETEVVKVPSHDGASLHVEVTRPAVDAPVPTVLVSDQSNYEWRSAGERPWDEFIRDWVPRGYAVAVADVRGFGYSEGCVEVWGRNEQLDQVALVEWVAQQEWSDGNVGMFGISYDATTAVEAAVHAPEPLKAVVAVAPVINTYDDWHFGGVSNGDSLSTVAYQASDTSATVEPADPATTLTLAANGLCDPTLAARANDPRAVYDAFYEERNFSARAKDVKAAVLYTQGFEDFNVKPSMVTHWLNALESPKLALLGHWAHQQPPRADAQLLFLAWMDQHVKGRPMGFESAAPVHVTSNLNTVREAQTWPPDDAEDARYHLDFDSGRLASGPGGGSATILLDSIALPPLLPLPPPPRPPLPLPRSVALETTVDEPLQLAGSARVELTATLQNAENAHVAALLYDGDALVTWGMINLAHRYGHHRYDPVTPGEEVRVALPLLPVEHVFQDGSTMRIEVRAARVDDFLLVTPSEPGRLTLLSGEDGTRLVLPIVQPGKPGGATVDWRLG